MHLDSPSPSDCSMPGTLLNPPASAGRRASFFPTGTIVGGCFAAGLIFHSRVATAQEAIRNSLATEAANEARHAPSEEQPYTVKTGDFRLLLTPSIGLDWNDNVNLQKTNREADFVLRPAVGIIASYPVTERNLLLVNLTCGYNEYFNHSDLSRLYIATGSQISFNVFVKDFQFNFHDNFAFSQDSATEAAVAGTGSYGTFQNTAGLSGAWNYGDLVLTLGYDHQNIVATSSQFNNTDHSSELPLGRAGVRLNPELTLGVEATGSFTAYKQAILNDNSGWSTGVYGEWKPGDYLSVTPRFGYLTYYFRQTSPIVPASDETSWYADLTMSHQATKFLTYSLSVGHELRLGIESDAIEDTYVRESTSWKAFKDISVGSVFSYEQGTQRGGQLATNFGENYSQFSVGVNLTYALMKHLDASLYYRLTLRTADVGTAEYTQNVVGISLSYALQ